MAKTAEEMFKEFGYKRRNDTWNKFWIDFSNEKYVITFLKKSKRVIKVLLNNEDIECDLDFREMLAVINSKTN